MKISDIEVSYIDHMGSDLSVVNAARVSFAKVSEWVKLEAHGTDKHGAYTDTVNVLSEADRRLIKYLAKHKHYSPFNHTFLTVRIKAPIFVSRQLVKHEYLPWNEVSRRYVDSEPEFYMPELRLRAENIKQGSSEDIYKGDLPFGNFCEMPVGIYDLCVTALDLYADMLRKGIAPEIARSILPQNTMTEWVWSGTLKAFHKMLSLRLDPHTQFETRIVAEKILLIIYEHFPISIEALLSADKDDL